MPSETCFGWRSSSLRRTTRQGVWARAVFPDLSRVSGCEQSLDPASGAFEHSGVALLEEVAAVGADEHCVELERELWGICCGVELAEVPGLGDAALEQIHPAALK